MADVMTGHGFLWRGSSRETQASEPQSEYGLTVDNMLATLPLPLAEDDKMRAIATSIAELLSARVAEVKRAALYQTISAMPSDLLGILAKDFRVDWFCSDDDLPEKQATITMLWRTHRAIGTSAAVALGISSRYPFSDVVEWFDYEGTAGEKYHFKLRVPRRPSSVTPEIHARILQLVETCKNVRSMLDSIEYVGRLLVDECGIALVDEDGKFLIEGDDE